MSCQPYGMHRTKTTRLVTDNDFDHILGTDFSNENDRLTG